jgi:hypothetical protein
MAWTSPITFLAGSALTANFLNTYIRDNLNEMAPAKATSTGSLFVTTGVNAITERLISGAVVTTSQTTSSTSYVDLATSGPAVTLTTGTQALVFVSADLAVDEGSGQSMMSFAVSGATTVAAGTFGMVEHTGNGTLNSAQRLGALRWIALTAGSNTFTAKYKTAFGTSVSTFSNRRIWVMAL